MRRELVELIGSSGRSEEAVDQLLSLNEDEAAAELAVDAQLWRRAADIYERLDRWGDASDMHELAGDIEHLARLLLGHADEAVERTVVRLDALQHILCELDAGELAGA